MNEDDILRDALSGIKTKRTRRRISRFNPEDGLLLDVEEGKVYVPGKGIIHVQEIREKILDCGHSANFGLGHIAECGHTVCALCIERFVLECGKEGCFKKLCTVRKCRCRVRSVDSIFFCRRHSVMASICSFAGIFLPGRIERGNRIKAIIDEYYSRKLQIGAGDDREERRFA